MDICIQKDKIYVHVGDPNSKEYSSYRIKMGHFRNTLEKNNIEKEDQKANNGELWSKTTWTHKQWEHFFVNYLTAKNKQTSGKLHSILESFGGSEKEVKARKSVAFQLLDLHSPLN